MVETKHRAQAAQIKFLSSPADIAIYGGAAGGGKTWALLAEALRHVKDTPEFNAVIFRRNSTQVRNPGGLWDESMKFYPKFHGAIPTVTTLEWRFNSGAKIKFAHLEYDSTVYDWQGSQICLLAFDELTHFSRSQFFYMLSRNRSTCAVSPYVRATCNPDADSWVADFIKWWIDQKTGKAIPERSGKLRWFVNINDALHWADTPEELMARFGADVIPKSATFIAASLFDNKILMESDPGYLANLKALPLVERERLLEGNWIIRPQAGLYFRREWINVIDAAPAELKPIRYWDLAATEKTANNDPDFTACIKMARDDEGRFYVLHGMAFRASPLKVQQAIKNMAAQDGNDVTIGLPQDPGQAGKSQALNMAKMLAGHKLKIRAETGNKITRFEPFSAQCEAGNVCFVRGDWNEEFFRVLEGFPDAAHDDHADACSGAFNLLMEARPPMRISPDVLQGRRRVI